ncbi:MAG: FAD-dependent oxidoreductase [Cyanobacteria bacterium]|nr:FAD-dependent oxidoreductase [Cyanobacteriota bacterium]
MKKLAIVGSGIAGLGCAHFLHQQYDISLFDQNDYPGGHTNTVTVVEDGVDIPIDTGFMVYNLVTYPNLIRLFDELKVPVKATDMSFSVQNQPQSIEWNGAGLNRIFGQRKNLFNLRFWKMLQNLNRFNQEAVETLESNSYDGYSIEEYVAEKGYGQDFLDLYMLPMGSAIWSSTPEKMLQFPARTLMRFFYNHGFLGLSTHFQWYTVDKGSKSYVERLIPPFKDKIFLNRKVSQVIRHDRGVDVCFQGAEPETFDQVILACHGDQAYQILANPSEMEADIFSKFQYSKNLATLHTDVSVMPENKRCWGSWNYLLKEDADNSLGSASTHYWMNNLQGLSGAKHQYFVSINAPFVDPKKVLKTIPYEHPIFSVPAIAVQSALPKLNQQSPQQTVFFCGSYFKYGFHEDAFTAALELSRVLSETPIWG